MKRSTVYNQKEKNQTATSSQPHALLSCNTILVLWPTYWYLNFRQTMGKPVLLYQYCYRQNKDSGSKWARVTDYLWLRKLQGTHSTSEQIATGKVYDWNSIQNCSTCGSGSHWTRLASQYFSPLITTLKTDLQILAWEWRGLFWFYSLWQIVGRFKMLMRLDK